LGWDQRTGTLPKRKPPDSAAITYEMQRNYRLDLERGPTKNTYATLAPAFDLSGPAG
jgi:hypothetical protein